MRVKKTLWISMGIVVFLGALVLLIANMNIACDLVAHEAQSAVKEFLQADLKLGQVNGNPLRGYKILEISLSKDGAEMLKADFVEAKVDLMSLMSSPRLSLLSIGGVNMDLDKFVEEINKLTQSQLTDKPSGQSSDQPFQVPIDELKIVQSTFLSQWGKLEIEDVGLDFNQYIITANLKGKVNELPAAGTLAVEVKEKSVTLKNVDLRVGQGTVKASGQLLEELNIEGSLEYADISELISLLPELTAGDYVGAVRTSFNVTGTLTDPVFSATASFKGKHLAGWPIESFDGMVNYKELRLSLDKITASIFGIPLSGNLAMAFRDVTTVFIQLSGGAVDLASLANLEGIEGISGNISDFTIDIKGPTDALSGTVSLHAPTIGASGVKGTDAALQVKLTGGNQATVSGKMQLQGAAAFASGTVSDILSGPKLNVTFKVVDLNVAAIKALIPDAGTIDPKGNITAEVNVKGTMVDPSFDGTLSSKSFSAAGYSMDNIAIGFSYANGNFTLKDSSASWSGLPVKASGTVKNVMAVRPNVDIHASLTMNPAALVKFVPDIAQYKLKGNVQVGIHATGALPEPKLDLVISSQELAAMDMINAKNIKVTTALAGDLTKLDNVDLGLTAQSLSASGLGFQNVNAQIKKTGETINLVSAKASSGQGSLSGSGRFTTPKSGAGDININVDMTQLNLHDLSKTGDLGVDLAGTFSGKLTLTGKADAPSIALQGGAPKLSVAGYSMDNLTIGLSGNMTNLKIDSFSAQVGTGKLSASGNLKPSDGTGQINFTGSGLDLAKLTESVPDLKGQISGILSAQFNANITGKGASGQGNATVPSLKIYGMQLTEVALPLVLDGVNFKFGQGAAKLHGGTLSLNGTVNTQTLKYTGDLKASGVDVNALIKDLVPDLGGSITGKGAMDLAFNGTVNPKFTLGGTGHAKIGSGSLSGFKWLDLVSQLHGVNSVRYTDVTSPFKLETTRIILQKGSKATAPENDPLYKYVQIEGPITYAGGLNLTGDGNMNAQLINVFSGGASGAIEALVGGSVNLRDILYGTVKGGSAAGQHADFRDVSFKVSGNTDNPSLSIVKVGQSSIPANNNNSGTQRQPQNIQDAVKDRVLDRLGIQQAEETPVETPKQPQAVSPDTKQQQETEQPQQQQQQRQQQQRKPEDIIKEEAGKAIQDLFRRR